MIVLKGDKDGFAGRYEAEGKVWKVAKVYLGKGIGARWMVEGPYFSKGDFFNWADIRGIVANWMEQGAAKTA